MSYARETVAFTSQKRDALRVAYNRAVGKGQEKFTFNGREYLTAYAKYVLEYLDGQFRADARNTLSAGKGT